MEKDSNSSGKSNASAMAAQEKELKKLRTQLRGMEILLKQNAALEKEVERLCTELDEATMGVQMKGYLYKFRDRVISYASKWGLRYFVLQGNKLSYFSDDKEHRPRRTLDLSRCFVRQDGVKKCGVYTTFGIYLKGDGVEVLLMKLSSNNDAEASLWIDMLEQACSIKSNSTSPKEETSDEGGTLTGLHVDTAADDWGNSPIDASGNIDDSDISSDVMKRVRSASLILKKSMSRQLFGARTPTRGNTPRPSTANLKDHQKDKGTHKSKDFPAYKPMHVESIASPLSSENTHRKEQNFRGFFNLGVIILVISHFDLIVNNLARYGLKISVPILRFTTNPGILQDVVTSDAKWTILNDSKNGLLTIASMFLSMFLSYLVEKLAARKITPESFTTIANIMLCIGNIVIPCIWTWYSSSHPVTKMVYLFQSVVMWMKLISYAHANRDLRQILQQSKEKDKLSSSRSLSASVNKLDDYSSKPSSYNESMKALFTEVQDLEPPYLQYPSNITIANILYFSVIPTLCYQLNYPRSHSVRWKYVLSLLLRMATVSIIMFFSIEQYIIPTVIASAEALDHFDVPRIIERLLRLSIPNTYVWLLGFYLYFHLWLNLLAELTRFGDRQFYKDWWNARTIDRYWRTWNMPVHHWIIRHLYYPLIRHGVPKAMAPFCAFLFSALFHEIVISIPFQHILFHAFFGMLAQAPLILITKYVDKRFENAFVGNAIFWCLFCVLGQPMGVMMYYHDLLKYSS